MKVFLLLMSLSFFGASANQTEEAYRKGQDFGRENNQVDMGKIKNTLKSTDMEFLEVDKDVSSFTNDSVYSRPANKEAFDFLVESNSEKTNSNNAEKLQSKSNELMRISADIEENPLLQGGQEYSIETTSTTKKTRETCLEGASFKIDMFAQLTFVPPPLKTFFKEEKKNSVLSWPEQDRYLRMCYDQVKQRISKKGMYSLWSSSGSIVEDPKNPCKISLEWVKGYCVRNKVIPNCEDIVDFRATKMHYRSKGNMDWGDGGIASAPVGVWDLGGWKHWYGGCLGALEVVIRTEYQKRDGDGEEYWTILNEDAEKLAEENSCFEVGKECLESGWKIIDGFEVHRDCWKRKRTYQCSGLPEDGCKHLEEKGCLLEKSDCTKKSGGLCLQYNRTFLCKSKESSTQKNLKGGDIFCLNGDCFTPEALENNDMKEAVSKLAVFQEMQKEMKTDPIRVFGGESCSCSKTTLDFINCCSSFKGWGRDLGLGSCSAGEKALAKRRSQGLCHYVGSYCAQKFCGECIRRKQTFCCFASKMSRIFQEQGRKQLGIEWGSARYPDCIGLTVERLQELDLDSMDLSEVFADIQSIAAAGIAKSMKIIPNVIMDKSAQEEKIKSLQRKNKSNMQNGNVVETTY